MRRACCILSAIVLVVCFSYTGFAQEGKSIVHPEQYWGDTGLYLDRQGAAAFDLVGQVLIDFPPAIPEPVERRLALYVIDGILHDPEAPARESVQAFHHARIKRVLDALGGPAPSQGMDIWKLYDHGFIVRTAGVTIAFDIIRGYSSGVDEFAVSDVVVDGIVEHCDVLFVSHVHRDHADDHVAGLFISQGKPVIAPDNVFTEVPFADSVTRLDRLPHSMQSLSLGGGTELEVIVYPGHQGDLLNNVVSVKTPEGFVVSHTGDQANEEDFGWIDEAGGYLPSDVLMPNCWATDIVRLADGFDAGVVITGHENELGHTIDHREPYWLTYRRFAASTRPLVLMTWGECFHYNPENR